MNTKIAAIPMMLVTTSSGPAFCNGLDCPLFTVINTTADYEVRKYPVSYWTSTSFEARNLTVPEEEGFNRLFNYISGANDRHEKVPMTAPVQVRITPGQGPFCDSTYVVSFFVPFALQPDKAPQPTQPGVYLRTEAEHTAFVRVFGGFAKETDVTQQAASLYESLARDNVSFNSTFYVSAGYDSPYKVFDRHNEVWFFGL